MDASSFHLGLFDKDDFVIKVWRRHGKRLDGARFVGGANEGIVGWLRCNRQPLLVIIQTTEHLRRARDTTMNIPRVQPSLCLSWPVNL